MLDRFDREIDIEVWPVQVMRAGKFDVRDRRDRCLLEPWKSLERKEQFALTDEQPKPVR